MLFPADLSLWDIILNLRPVPLAVIAILILFSLFSWTIVFAKSSVFGRARRDNRKFLRVDGVLEIRLRFDNRAAARGKIKLFCRIENRDWLSREPRAVIGQRRFPCPLQADECANRRVHIAPAIFSSVCGASAV